MINPEIRSDLQSVYEEVMWLANRPKITADENYEAMKSKGDYEEAGIHLVNWSKIKINMRKQLWKKMLNGKVANADDYKVN
jgi:hypothetical protein